MKKIPTIYKRDPERPAFLLHEPHPDCAWVFRGEGTPTRKFDGIAIMSDGKSWFKRYDCKQGRTPPTDFIAADEPDAVTGHWPGWVPVTQGPEDKWIRWAIDSYGIPVQGMHEACGPHFNGNPEKLDVDQVIPHGIETLVDERLRLMINQDDLKAYFLEHDIEGVVWHHPDGRMAKIKAKDLGVKRGNR